MKKVFFFLGILGIFGIVVGIYLFYKDQQPATFTDTQTQPTQQVAGAAIGERSKISDCVAQQALPDSDCTPGDVIPTATKTEICKPGYSASVRNVSVETKQEVYNEYGITHHGTGEYEVDHLISLELGGSNDIANLWPEAAEPKPGFHEKDEVENYLHDQVCNGLMSLQVAQQKIATNWLEVYQKMQK